MASNTTMIRKLQQALNSKGCKLLYSTSQFYSDKQDRPVTMYYIKQAVFDEVKGRNMNQELFCSTSQIQVVLFLRDMWFDLNGWEIPTDNEVWEQRKKQMREKGEEANRHGQEESSKKDDGKKAKSKR